MGTRNTLHAYLSNLSNWVYRYGTRPGKWTQILRQPDRPASEMPLPRFAHQVAYTPFTRSVFLHGGNAGNFNEVSTKGAGVKGSRDADGDNIESEDGREVSVAGVKERRLDDFWRMELKRSVGLCCCFAKFLLTRLFAGLGQMRSLDKPSFKFDANSKPNGCHIKG
jgi:muskelin